MSIFEINIEKLKEKIRAINSKTPLDDRVLAVVDSFWGCSDNYIRANLKERLHGLRECRAAILAMEFVYGNQEGLQ